jgi:hypothetical protein
LSRCFYGNGWEGYTGIVLNAGLVAFYVWAVLKWYHATYELTNMKTTFRAWKVNFLAFWVYVSVTAIDILLTAFFSKS